MATALIKLTQGVNVGDGQALKGTTGTAVQVANSNNAGVGSWEILLLEVPYLSALVPGSLASGDGNTPLTSFNPDVVGGCYRLQLTVWPQASRQGTPDIDIRNFGVNGANGICPPPPQVWPLPLPDPRSGRAGAKPNEMNFSGQDDGWAGTGNDGLLRHALRILGFGSGDIKSDGSVAFAADQSMGNHKLTNLATPTNANDAVTKSYADGLVSGLSIRPNVLVVSTANIAALTGLATTVDGVALNTDGQRVLLTGQTTATQNGPWVVHSGAWTRPTDFAAGSDAASAYFFVQQGASFSDTGWVCTSNSGSAVVGTNNLAFVQFSAAGVPLAGNGLSKTGQTFAVVATDTSIVVAAGLKVADQMPARGTKNVIVDLTPEGQGGGNIATASTITLDVPITSGKWAIVTFAVRCHASNVVKYIKNLQVIGQNNAGTVTIDATTTLVEVFFEGAVYTLAASISGTNIRATLSNTSGSTRTYSIIAGKIEADL